MMQDLRANPLPHSLSTAPAPEACDPLDPDCPFRNDAGADDTGNDPQVDLPDLDTPPDTGDGGA